MDADEFTDASRGGSSRIGRRFYRCDISSDDSGDQPGIDLLLHVIPARNILFASEMIGAVRGIDPESGHHYDDTRRYVDAAHTDNATRHAVYEGNARRVYPRLDAALKAKGH